MDLTIRATAKGPAPAGGLEDRHYLHTVEEEGFGDLVPASRTDDGLSSPFISGDEGVNKLVESIEQSLNHSRHIEDNYYHNIIEEHGLVGSATPEADIQREDILNSTDTSGSGSY